MAIYEYRCNACGQVFEKIVRWPESERQQLCPNCQSQDTQKKVSAAASLRGSSGSAGCGTAGRFR